MPPPLVSTPLGAAIDRSGFRREFLARRCGVEPWTLSRWIRGTSRPDEAQQLVLAALLHMDLEDLQTLLPSEANAA